LKDAVAQSHFGPIGELFRSARKGDWSDAGENVSGAATWKGRGNACLEDFTRPVIVHPIQGVDELSKWQVTLGRGTAAFVGRETEQSHLLTLGEAAAAGAGRNTIVSGEPGVGKSRLAREVLRVLRQRGWRSMEVECRPIVGDSRFALLKSILAAATSTLSDAETSGAQSRAFCCSIKRNADRSRRSGR
jgi:hypothetical protein